MKLKIIYKLLFFIISFIAFVFILLYISWDNRTTYVHKRWIQKDIFAMQGKTVSLKRKEVKPYFEKLARSTGQNALINIKDMPSEKFHPIRELKNKLLFYYIIAVRRYEISYMQNADYYKIDCLGLATYHEFYSDFGVFSSDFICSSPSYQNIYKYFNNNHFDISNNGLDIKSLDRPFWTGLINYPVIVDRQKNVLINIHYLHSIKDIFPGIYAAELSCDVIEYEGKKLLIDDEKAILTYEKKLTEKSILLRNNRIIKEYKMYKFGDLKYIDIDVISDLYQYKIDKTFISWYFTNDLDYTYGANIHELTNFIRPINTGTYRFHDGLYIGCFVEIDNVSEK